MGEYSPIGAAIAWGRGAASKVLAGTTMAAATGGTGAVAAAGAGGGGALAGGGGILAAGGGGTLAPSGGVAMAGGGGVIPGINSPLTAPPHTPPASPGGTRWFAVAPGGANMPFNFRVNGRRYS